MDPSGGGAAIARMLLRTLQRLEGPSPAARAPPGYLRAFTAEAAPQAVETAAATAAADAAATTGRYAAAAATAAGTHAAPAARVSGPAGRVMHEDRHARVRLASFLGLTEVLEQQQVQLAAGVVGGGQHRSMSPALRAMTWHQSHMDDSPAGRELRRNWQRQVILETKALEATRARYQKEALSAISRGQAASALPEARQMLLRWFAPLTAAIQREQQRVGLWVGGSNWCLAVHLAARLHSCCRCCCAAACTSAACKPATAATPSFLPHTRTALLLPCTTPRRLLLQPPRNPHRSHKLNTLPDTGRRSVPPAAAVQIILGARGIDRKVYGPYLLLLEAEQLAVLTMHSVINSIVAPEEAGGGAFSSPGQARVTRLSLNLGKVRGSGGTRWQEGPAGGREGRRRNTVAGGHILVGWTGMRVSLCASMHVHMQLHLHTPGTCPDPDALMRCGRPIHHTPAATPLPCSMQAVEAQVNLEKLQAEAHTHNLLRAEVKDLYLQVGGRCTAGVLQYCWKLPLHLPLQLHSCRHNPLPSCTHAFLAPLTAPSAPHPAPPLLPSPPPLATSLHPQGYELRQRLQTMREVDPAAALSDDEWQQWLAIGNRLRDLGEVPALDAHDWFVVSGNCGGRCDSVVPGEVWCAGASPGCVA